MSVLGLDISVHRRSHKALHSHWQYQTLTLNCGPSSQTKALRYDSMCHWWNIYHQRKVSQSCLWKNVSGVCFKTSLTSTNMDQILFTIFCTSALNSNSYFKRGRGHLRFPRPTFCWPKVVRPCMRQTKSNQISALKLNDSKGKTTSVAISRLKLISIWCEKVSVFCNYNNLMFCIKNNTLHIFFQWFCRGCLSVRKVIRRVVSHLFSLPPSQDNRAAACSWQRRSLELPKSEIHPANNNITLWIDISLLWLYCMHFKVVWITMVLPLTFTGPTYGSTY